MSNTVFNIIIRLFGILCFFALLYGIALQGHEATIARRQKYKLVCFEDSFGGIIQTMEYDRGFLLVETSEKLMLDKPENGQKHLGLDTPYIEKGDSIYKKKNSKIINVLSKKRSRLYTFRIGNVLCNSSFDWIQHKE